MKHLLTTLAAALFLAGSAWAEPATIYGTLTRTAQGDGINSPPGRYYIVKTKYPVTVEMESYEQSEEGKPPVIVRVITSEIQIVGDFDKSLVGKQVRVHGDTWAPQNWNHITPVLITADSVRAPAPLAPPGSNER